MNKDILEGKWRQIKGSVKAKWGKLTDDDLDKIEGNYDMLVGKIQERYGYGRDAVEAELAKMMAKEEAARTP
jgi:uncharacterized protein YjbJ (UPF0337 family)